MAETAGERRSRRLLAGGLGAMAVLHVVAPRPFEAMIPSWLPGDRRVWNLAAAAAEGTSATLLAREATAGVGGRAAFATFAGVWTANVQAAVDGGYRGVPGWAGSAQAAWLRVPLQLPLLWWAARIARHPRVARSSAGLESGSGWIGSGWIRKCG